MKRFSYRAATAIGLSLACASAMAADPLPDSLSLGGVTVYGTVDVGYAYQSHGVPVGSQLPGGLEYQAFTTTRNFAGSVSTLAESGLEQSKIGIRVAEPIAGDFTLIATAETGFNPLSGQLTDACASIANNSGKAQGQQTGNADSSRCGQAFNSVLFGGASSTTLGTLTIGRQNSLQLSALSVTIRRRCPTHFRSWGIRALTAAPAARRPRAGITRSNTRTPMVRCGSR
jgi:predicted porin